VTAAALSTPARSSLRARLLALGGPFVGLVLVMLLFALLEPDSFLSVYNFQTIAAQTVIVGLGALGMTFVIVSGGIDLSVGASIALSSVITALLMQQGASALIASQRPVLMIELDESLNKGALARLATQYAALNYRAFFLSLDKLRPISEFEPARHQNAANLKPHHKLPRGVEYINNFVFVPEEKSALIFARL